MQGKDKKRVFRKILEGLLIIVMAGVLWRMGSHGWLAVNFVDEQDNFVVGSYVAEGEKVYGKVFTHHQPMSYLVSAGIQKAGNPNTIQSLIKQERMLISLWSIAWMVFLGLRFGVALTIGMSIFEMVKGIYLGNMFLAESLAVAPVIYLVLIYIKDTKSKIETMFVGGVMAFVALLLAPLLPLVGIMGAGWIARLKKEWKRVAVMIVSGLLVVVLSINFIDIEGYVREAIMINKEYYIKIAGGENMVISLLRSLISPFVYLIEGPNIREGLVIKFMLLGYFVGIAYLLKAKRFGEAVTIWVLIGLSNLRNFELWKIHYDAFHLIMWVGLVINMGMYLLRKKRVWMWVALAPMIFLMVAKIDLIKESPNYEKDFEIYYSRIFNMSEAILSTKEEGDRLLSMPDETLPYWKGGIERAGRFIFFYKWMSGVETLREEQVRQFESRPEYMIIKREEGLSIDGYLAEYQKFSYRGSEDASEFFIRKDVYEKMSEEKIKKLNYYGLVEI